MATSNGSRAGQRLPRRLPDRADIADLVPADPGDFHLLLDALVLEKVLYEVRYELDNRPGWGGLALRGPAELRGRRCRS